MSRVLFAIRLCSTVAIILVVAIVAMRRDLFNASQTLMVAIQSGPRSQESSRGTKTPTSNAWLDVANVVSGAAKSQGIRIGVLRHDDAGGAGTISTVALELRSSYPAAKEIVSELREASLGVDLRDFELHRAADGVHVDAKIILVLPSGQRP